MAKYYDYNLIVIGAGSAGLVNAYIAAATQAKVLIIEKNAMGGDCLNTGCVPSKALIHAAQQVHAAKKMSLYGIDCGEVNIDFSKIISTVHEAIAKVAPHDSIERYTQLGVECIAGEATLIDKHHVQVGDQRFSAKNIVIASGAQPFIPSIAGIENIQPLSSENLWNLTQLPPKLVVVGGGPVACEIAQAFTRLGSQVTVLVRSGRILAKEDTEVATLLQQELSEQGVKFIFNCKINTIESSQQIKIVQCTAGNQQQEIDFDEILFATGRKANTQGFGLENCAIELNDDGTIKVNAYLQTSCSTIFACGDVAGPYQFTHAAAHQAWYTAVNALFGRFKKFKVDYRVLPWVTYTDPEVAKVGLNELEATQKNISYEVTTFPMGELDRAIIDNNRLGFVKVLTVPGKDKILGVTIVSSHAADMLAEFVLAMKYDIGLKKILAVIHSYPSYVEANKYVAGKWQQSHTAEWLKSFAKRLHAFFRKV